MKKIIASTIVFLSSFTIVYAATMTNTVVLTGVNNVNNLALQVLNYFNLAVEMMVAAAVAWIIWSSFKFVLSGGDEEKRAESRAGIIYGIIGLIVMLSVWGIVSLVASSTGLDGKTKSVVTSPIL